MGEYYIRLLCYLDLTGYRVIELERMSAVKRNYFELIGHRILSGAEASQLLGYSAASVLYQVLFGEVGASKEKEQMMWEIWKERREPLKEAKSRAANENKTPEPKDTSLYVSPKPAAPLHVSPRAKKSPPHAKANRLVALNMMEGLLALLQEGALEGLTLEELSRRRFNPNMVLSLQSELHDMSSKLFVQKTEERT